MANRKQRAELAKETVRIQEEGFYKTYEGETVQLSEAIKQCNENSRIFTQKDFPSPLSKTPNNTYTTEFEVTTEYSISACLRLAAEMPSDEKIACLNFASAKNPGGGMLNGSLAQEESICLCSCLYSCLTQFHDTFYEVSRKDPRNGLYHTMLIYSPRCVVIRNDVNYQLLDNNNNTTTTADATASNQSKLVRTSFITCPAVNKGVALSKNISEAVISGEMRARAELVLQVAMEMGERVLVLGAWGCGVFHNQPRDVADIFVRLLKGGGVYEGVFRKVVFAVGKEPRMNVFREKFA